MRMTFKKIKFFINFEYGTSSFHLAKLLIILLHVLRIYIFKIVNNGVARTADIYFEYNRLN